MKILIEMTEQEYDKYREYLAEQQVTYDTDIKSLKEAEIIEELKDVVRNARMLEGLDYKPKRLDEVKNGAFRRAELKKVDIPKETPEERVTRIKQAQYDVLTREELALMKEKEEYLMKKIGELVSGTGNASNKQKNI